MSIANRNRYALSICTLGAMLLAGCGGSQPIANPAVPQLSATTMRAGQTSKKTFHYTGAAQTFVVPAKVTELTVTASGASGASGGPSSNYGAPGGNGGVVRATIPVTSGETLAVCVGGSGSSGGRQNAGGKGCAGGSSNGSGAKGCSGDAGTSGTGDVGGCGSANWASGGGGGGGSSYIESKATNTKDQKGAAAPGNGLVVLDWQ